MSAPMSVFLHSSVDCGQMAVNIERVLSIKLTHIIGDEFSRYEHRGVGYTMVLLSDHGLEDDMGIAFSQYRHEIDFDVTSTGASDECAVNLKHWLAMYTFSALVSALKCPGMVVYNLQRLVTKID